VNRGIEETETLTTTPFLKERCGSCAHLDHYGAGKLTTWFCRLALRRGIQPAAIARDDKACASWELGR